MPGVHLKFQSLDFGRLPYAAMRIARVLRGLLLLVSFAKSGWTSHAINEHPLEDVVAVEQTPLSPAGLQRLGGTNGGAMPTASTVDALTELRSALAVMQQTWFALWIGTWPTAIDWTAAVLNTHLVSSLATFSRALHHAANETSSPNSCHAEHDLENELNAYFAQSTAYYFGEDIFSLRLEAYDDMLWVVLGWLEAVKTARLHSRLHYRHLQSQEQTWHGAQFIDAYAHRIRVFYELATHGWSNSLCGGGMTWSPWLGPYKNAITNQLYISASVAMYLYFPGDDNVSPWNSDGTRSGWRQPQNTTHLQAAKDGYDWLANSGMRNRKGLYVDGFHVSRWRANGTTCDIRNEEVYTYNQGVILSGLRGLWESTGNTTYLKDGHDLVTSVVKATGWNIDLDKPSKSPRWAGIGRAGILEETCDSSGTCHQDPQSFKGVFFHHLTLFCDPLPTVPMIPGKTFAADSDLELLHRFSCKGYLKWIRHNAEAALTARDDRGRFGTWWGAHVRGAEVPSPILGAIDYRNDASLLRGELWRPRDYDSKTRSPSRTHKENTFLDVRPDRPMDSIGLSGGKRKNLTDPNDRGEGRTVETQSGGVAVLRALWEISHIP